MRHEYQDYECAQRFACPRPPGRLNAPGSPGVGRSERIRHLWDALRHERGVVPRAEWEGAGDSGRQEETTNEARAVPRSPWYLGAPILPVTWYEPMVPVKVKAGPALGEKSDALTG